MKTKLLFILMTVLLISGSAFAQKQKISVEVDSFYKLYRTRSGTFNANEVALLSKWFSSDLTKLFQAELKREKEYLKLNPTDKPHFGDGFPFAPIDECAKNGKSFKNSYKMGATIVQNGKVFAEVQFYNPKTCGGNLIDSFKVEVVKSKNIWLVNDWLYPDGTKLTDDLRRGDY